ncbi:MAG: phage tail sheath subtilisin-like domain-containing protein, partial [Solirubrobacterales bacterium]
MGLPSMNILFKTTGGTFFTRGDRGVVALILRDAAVPANPVVVMNSVDDIPATLSSDNKEQIELTFKGYINAPNKVIAYIQAAAATDYTAPQTYFETADFDYIAVPGIGDSDVAAFAAWVKGLIDNKDKKVQAVLPNSASDHEGIINFSAASIITATKTYTAKQYCGRIAGLLAGTPLNMSATYAPLPELTDCDHLTKTDMNTAIDAGKLILMNDGRKVKVARAVNSLVTVTADKGAAFKKIKIVDIMNQIHNDIKSTIEDNYIGKIQNDYDHKVLLVSAISNYFDGLEMDGLLDKGKSSVYIDLAAQKLYL